MPGSFLLSAYDPRDGTRLWWVGGLSFEMKSTPVLSGDTLYINGFGSSENQPGAKVTVAPTVEVFAASDVNKDGKLSPEEMPTTHARRSLPFTDLDGDKHLNRDEWDYYKAAADSENGMLAIKLGGSGDMTATAVRWRYQRGIPQLPSPLLYKDALYMVNDAGGMVTTLRPETGELIQQGRLKVPSDTLLRVAGRGGREDLHRQRERQGHRPASRRRPRGPRGQRSAGQHLRDAGPGGRPDLHADAEFSVLLRDEVTASALQLPALSVPA